MSCVRLISRGREEIQIIERETKDCVAFYEGKLALLRDNAARLPNKALGEYSIVLRNARYYDGLLHQHLTQL